MTGTWDVDGLLEQIPAELFTEWIAYYRQEPFGDEWLQTSYICSIVRNLLATKESDILDLDYFVPSFTDKKKRPPRFDAKAHEAQMAAMFKKS